MDPIVAGVAMAATAVVALWFVWHVYNRLVGLRNKVQNAWADVDVQLTYRHGLVPNLVASVKGYMEHERQTFESVAQANAASVQAGQSLSTLATAEATLSLAVSNLLIRAEKYPELKASQNFLLLQEQLTTTEKRIAFARQHYNETVREFNTTIAQFPWNLLADAFRYTPQQLFAAEPPERAVSRIAS